MKAGSWAEVSLVAMSVEDPRTRGLERHFVARRFPRADHGPEAHPLTQVAQRLRAAALGHGQPGGGSAPGSPGPPAPPTAS